MNIIKKYRKDRGMTQKKLSEKAGISHSIIAKAETYAAMPYLTTVEKLSKALKLSKRFLAKEIEKDFAAFGMSGSRKRTRRYLQLEKTPKPQPKEETLDILPKSL